MIKQIVIFVILAYNMLPQLVFAEELKKIFQEPITFNAKVGFEEEFPNFWVQIYDLKEFNRILPHTTGSNYNKSKQAYRIKVYGLKFERFTKTYDILNEWQESYVKNIIISETFDFKCLGVTTSRVLSCEMYIGEANLAEHMIHDGLSRFDGDMRIPSEINERYVAAENAAKEEKKGVWKSFIGLFSFDKQNKVK